MNNTPKIPTIIGLLLLAIIIGSGIFIVERFTKSDTRASETLSPQNIEITNVTDTSATVSWTTVAETTGVVSLSATLGKPISAFDDRDLSGNTGKYLTHHVTVRQLSPQTTYNVTILSDGKQFRNSENPWRVTTFPSSAARPSALEPAYGTILTGAGLPAKGALVYITLEGAQTLSTLTNASGSWVIPLTLARKPDGAAYVPTGERVGENIQARLGLEAATATTDTLNDAPVPEMSLGKTYDFRRQQGAKESPQGGALGDLITKSSGILGSQTSSQSAVQGYSITSPQENASLSTFLPLISGTGIAGKKVTVKVSRPEQTGDSTVGADGVWRFTPEKDLAPGEQILSVVARSESGEDITLTRNFEILKSGTQVLGIATPSGTLTPTPTGASASPTPRLTTTLTPTPTRVSTISAETLPVSGVASYTLVLIAAGFSLLAGGAAMLFRKNS